MKSLIYPKMFLFNAKMVSHFCLMALDIVLWGNDFFPNVFLKGLLGNEWYTKVKMKARQGSKELGLPGVTTTWVPVPKCNFPKPVVVTL